MIRKVILGLSLVCVLVVCANATVPTSITVQSKLTDSSGSPFPPGPKTFVFSIHDAEVGGSKVWPAVSLEYQTISTDPSGVWTANVGALVPLTDPVFVDTVRWLEIAVDIGGPVILPRIRLNTNPYSYRVATVDGASGGTITSKVSIGPGHTNTGTQAFIAGESNRAIGDYSTIGGGSNNMTSLAYSAVGGGTSNNAGGEGATVGGGANNSAWGTASAIGGGQLNQAGGEQSTISGGADNVAYTTYCTVGGGRYNKALGLSSTVGGGYENVATGTDSHIGGGASDSASGVASTVAGGSGHRAFGNFSAIGGGGNNRASATSATIAGGFQNVASADDATVSGGFNNEAYGYRSTIPGGTGNIAGGANSLACGVNAWAVTDQSFVWNDNPGTELLSLAPKHFIIGASGRVGLGTNAPEGYLHVFDGSAGSVTASVNSIAVFERDSAGYVSILTPSNTERGILFGQPGSVADGGIIYAATDPGSMQFRTAGNATRMVLDHNDVGLNGARLAIVSGIGTSSELEFRHSAGSAEATLTFDEPGSSNQLLVSVLGSIRMRFYPTSTAINGQLDVAGNVCATNVVCPSDERLKQDIRPIRGALTAVQRLNGVEYQWKEDVAAERNWSSAKQIGLLAQNVQKVAPQAVVEMSDGYLAVDYSRLVPLLIEGMKEQQKQIDELKSRLDAK